MKRTTITLAALLAALVPAAVGLWGNASFSQAVPVRVPASAQVVTPTSPATTADDHGGDTPRDQRSEPGDDHGGSSGTSTSGSSGSGSSGSGSSGSASSSSGSSGSGSSSGSASSGSGSDDSGSDDHGGSGGHGSDD